MIKPYTRHLILLFVVGLTWGYVVKTIIGTQKFIGWDDPQVISEYNTIDLNSLTPTQALTPPADNPAVVTN